LVEVRPDELPNPASLAPWLSHFPCKIYKSQAATEALRALLNCPLPGTPVSYATVLSAIGRGSSSIEARPAPTVNFCFLVGGQVRDILRGVLSSDCDFNYSCSAQEVAMVCVRHEWAVKYKPIGDTPAPNYVLIGDESSAHYLEGFPLSFNATEPCYKMDFRQNMCFYDLTNDVVLDKTGHGVEDIRARALRLSCAEGESYESWAAATITPGLKELRYVKFLLRARAKGAPLTVDAAERRSVVESLRAAMRTNGDALRGFWFRYVLEAQLESRGGVEALEKWVCELPEGAAWWEADWKPLVQHCAPEIALGGIPFEARKQQRPWLGRALPLWRGIGRIRTRAEPKPVRV
jgi:hypothetical protein